MAVLPWGHSRNHTSSSGEKSKASSLDWFSRTAGEPSRQAITQLMKQHPRDTPNTSVKLRIQSRSNTPTPQSPQHRSASSLDSRPGSAASKSLERLSSSRSRPATPLRPNTPGLERSDSSSKAFFQKGGLLRRQGSKMGANFNSNSKDGVVSPTRSTPSRGGFRVKETPRSPLKDEDRRPSISEPYDFAHVLHGDINSFVGLGRIDESDLALQFDAIQARYRTDAELGRPMSPEPETLRPSTVLDYTPVSTVDTSSLQQMSSKRPSTPPPAPPPKNSPIPATPTTPVDCRSSKSTENFSRPTPRSPPTSTVSPIRPTSCHLLSLASTSHIADPDNVDRITSKPLPQLPPVVHAVSTQDDTARLLIAAPLPAPPSIARKPVARHQRQSSSKGSLRHMSTFPSSRHTQNNPASHDGQLLGIKEEDVLTRPHSDYELTQHTHRPISAELGRSAVEFMVVEDWDVAIDSAWDVENDSASSVDDHTRDRRTSTGSRNRESYITINQPAQDSTSSPSTPLMTMSPPKHIQRITSNEETLSVAQDATEPSLVGLGIGSTGRSMPCAKRPRPPTLDISTTDASRPTGSPRLTRSAYSAISHSSSQESIILSIASSIMSTQRSSVSSISISDHAHGVKSDRLSVSNSAHSPLLIVNAQKPARPDSGCLPSSFMPQAKSKPPKPRPDSGCLPMAISKRTTGVTKTDRPDSLYLPQDLLANFPVPEAKIRPRQGAARRSSKTESFLEKNNVPEPIMDGSATILAGARGAASPRIPSTAGGDSPTSSRHRSNTQGSRSKNTRVSYSLFPNAAPAVFPTANLDVDSVAS